VQSSEHQTGQSRRSFYTAFIYTIWGCITAAIAAPAAAYLLLPPSVRRGTDWIDASDLGSIPNDVPTEVSFQHKRVDGWKITSEKATAWLVRKDENNVVAFSPQCTHLGCAYHWESNDKAFVCPCHASEFSIDGVVLAGPAPRPLDRYKVKIESGRVMLGPLEPHA
jgi:menaquinol-cytochrome c reductase iron-sulfur subunit